jgi:transcriptional/translational regulatory protein YebC/TACO1
VRGYSGGYNYCFSKRDPTGATMAGHSKWANIKHKKAATDAKRGKIFTRLIREITVAARMGGGVDCMTDNRTRTVADVRHAFSKYGGNLGTDGSVAFLFAHCGQLVFAPGTDENALMEAALEAGADDVITNDDGSIEVITGPYAFTAAKDALARAGFKPEFAEITMKPATEVELDGDDAVRMQKLIDALESLDDVQDVYTNAVLEEQESGRSPRG